MPTCTLDEIVIGIVRFVNTEIMASGQAIAAADRFDLAGVDSMALLKILLFVEREFGLWVPEEDLVIGNVASAAALGGYVDRRRRTGD
ncbi:MAG: phosphopantetheine-binding protein [Ardenticatenales bacterium]